MKFMIKAFVLLLLTNGLLVFMHYNEKGNAMAEGAKLGSYAQEIEVMHRADGLYVRHHFKRLPNARFEIVWPEESIDRACYIEEAAACTRLNEEATAFNEGDANNQSISYVIPKSASAQDMMFFKDVFATLHNAKVSSTLMHITDEMHLGGFWVNGLERVGEKKMDLVDYSLFRGAGAVSDLYWQQIEKPLLYTSNRLSVYGQTNDYTNEQIQEMTTALDVGKTQHATVVLNSKLGGIDGKRFIITNEPNLERIVEKIAIEGLHNQYHLPSDEKWTVEVVASLLSGQAMGSELAREGYLQLLEHLTDLQLEQLIASLREEEEEILDANLLTERFIEITGFSTSFFEKNRQVTDKLTPFVLEDMRGIYVSGEELLDQNVILRDDSRLYPITKVFSELGFDVTWNDRSLYIVSPESSYRFPLKEKFYIYNERRFDMLAMPFERIGEEFYFEEKALIRIFHAEIKKLDDRIDINLIGALTREAS